MGEERPRGSPLKRILLLVEGQTEERFVKTVLAPDFATRGASLKPTLLETKKVKDGPNFKGGVTSYGQVRNHLRRLLPDRNALVTTMLDYYGLPDDFPGMSDRPTGTTARARVDHVERHMQEEVRSRNFVPFLALHEFEAWLFASPDELPRTMVQPDRRNTFAAICSSVATPEDINESVATAPSKRIQAIFPSYQKTAHGPLVVQRIGLPAIRAVCPHFDEWLQKLEAFAA
jgi:hypothetical protein